MGKARELRAAFLVRMTRRTGELLSRCLVSSSLRRSLARRALLPVNYSVKKGGGMRVSYKRYNFARLAVGVGMVSYAHFDIL